MKFSVTSLLIVFFGLSGGTGANEQTPLGVWETLLKPHHFGETAIVEDKTVIDLVTPYRAEDAAVTPVRVKAVIPQTAERFIKTIYLFVDKNPEPLVGKFNFTHAVGRADLGPADTSR